MANIYPSLEDMVVDKMAKVSWSSFILVVIIIIDIVILKCSTRLDSSTVR